jgi:hypothetical protein
MNGKGPWAMSELEALAVDLQRFQHESGGVMRLFVVRHDDARLMRAVDRGEPLALTLAASVGRSLHSMKGMAKICLLCGTSFVGKDPPAFVVWLPTLKTETPNDHSMVLTQPVCRGCCRLSDREILAEAVAKLRVIMPETEIIEESEEYIDEE